MIRLREEMIRAMNLCSTVLGSQNLKSRARQGIQLSTGNGVVPTKSEDFFDGFYLLRNGYF